MPKLHHKLKYLTDYLNADLKSAFANTNNRDQALDTAIHTLGTALGDMHAAKKMRPLLVASEENYNNQNHKYNMKVAIFVSKHKIMSDQDYLRLKDALGNLVKDQKAITK